jgi:DNA-binding NarL/FixJ family response regulator
VIRVCIADDHILIRDGFAKLLDGEAEVVLEGAAGSAEELFDLLRRVACDVIILDIGLPDRSGLEVLKDVRAEYPQKRVLMLSMHPEERYAVRAIRSGAAGYISKSAASEELVKAIRKIHSGGRYISEALAEQLAISFSDETPAAPHEQLSDREFEILLLIGSGKSGAEIADELALSINTINTYRRRLMEKMSLRSSADIVQYVLRHRLIE